MRAPLAALALCLANLAACRSGPTPEELYVLRNQPRPLGPVALRDASTKTLRVRVWADEGHARAVMGWQVRFHEQVAAANPVLVANLGLELEVVTVRPWPRDGGRGDLIDDVNALMAHDKGDDVDLVIGLVTPLSTFNPTFSALGRANVLGRHIVMRSTDAPEEMAAFEQALRKASAEARADLYQARLRHKETLLLLHEVGHILGAPHVFMDRAVMSPHYDPQQDGFAPESLELMRMAVAAWEPGRGVPRETREAMAAHLEQRRWPGWSDEGRAQYARAFRTGRMPDEAPHEPTSPPRAAEPASKPAPLSPRERVAEALERGAPDEAWARLTPLLDMSGHDPELVNLACEVQITRDPTSDEARAWCERAVAARPERPGPHLRLAATQQRRDRAGALASVQAAEARIASLPEEERRPWYGAVAQSYQALDAYAMSARIRDQGDPELARELAVQERDARRAAHLEVGQLPPEQEPEFFALARALLDALRARDFAGAETTRKALAARFPAVAGPHEHMCIAAAEQREFAVAAAACGDAHRLAPRAPKPLLALGMVAFARGRPRQAIRPLEQAIALGEAPPDAYTLLSAAYRATGQAKKADALERSTPRRPE